MFENHSIEIHEDCDIVFVDKNEVLSSSIYHFCWVKDDMVLYTQVFKVDWTKRAVSPVLQEFVARAAKYERVFDDPAPSIVKGSEILCWKIPHV